MRKRLRAILLTVAALGVSCSSYFIAEYSEAVDGGATKLQQKVDGFLTGLQSAAGTAEGEYAGHEEFYGEARSDIDELRTAAAAKRGNDLTLQSLDLIADNLDKLERMHAQGISAKEIAIVRQLFDTQFRMLVQLENAKKRKEN
jgi:hypothetical protein